MLFENHDCSIQIVDIPTQTTVGYFVSLYGVSHLSLSTHDTLLAAVSSKGDQIYTYDLSFVPNYVSLTGRFIRGKFPGTASSIMWDRIGGFGMITKEKGSLHWFDKRRAIDNTNKIWKLPGWGIDSCGVVEIDANKLMLVKHNQILMGNINGQCIYKYDIPKSPIELAEGGPEDNDETTTTDRYDNVDPLSFYELESCLPYPFIHTDRRITISVFNEDEEQSIAHECNNGVAYPVLENLGQSIQGTVIDFGQAKGQVTFPESSVSSGSPSSIADEDLQIRLAMESIMLNNDELDLTEKTKDLVIPST